MKNKKMIAIIGIVCVVIIAVVLIIVLIKNGNNKEVVKREPLNESVNLEEVFNKVQEIEGMEWLESSDDNQEVEIKDETEIDFGKYSVLEKMAKINTDDEKVNEIWMIKLSDYNQQEDVCRILGTRVQKLKNAFEENVEQTKIIQEAVIKQEEGIVIMIISPYAKTIEETIANEM